MAKLSLLVIAGITLLVPSIACAQSYPSNPIRLIVPSAPGGAPDISARLIAGEMSRQMGQQVVVDNRPGANAIIGSEMIARAAPDGYTLGFLNQAFVTNPSLFAKLPSRRLRPSR